MADNDPIQYVAKSLVSLIGYAASIMRAEGASVLNTGHMNAALGVAGLPQMPDMEANNPEVTMVEGRAMATLDRRISPWIHENIEEATLAVMDSCDPSVTMKNLFSTIGRWPADFVIKSFMRRLTNDSIREAIDCGAAMVGETDVHPRDQRKYIKIPEGRCVAIYGALMWIIEKTKCCDPRLVLTELVPVVTSRLVMDRDWILEDRLRSAAFIGQVLSRTRDQKELHGAARKTTMSVLRQTAGDATMCWESRCGALLGLARICDAPYSIYAGIATGVLEACEEYERGRGEDLMTGHVIRAMHAYVSEVMDEKIDKANPSACQMFAAHASSVAEGFQISLAEWLAHEMK